MNILFPLRKLCKLFCCWKSDTEIQYKNKRLRLRSSYHTQYMNRNKCFALTTKTAKLSYHKLSTSSGKKKGNKSVAIQIIKLAKKRFDILNSKGMDLNASSNGGGDCMTINNVGSGDHFEGKASDGLKEKDVSKLSKSKIPKSVDNKDLKEKKAEERLMEIDSYIGEIYELGRRLGKGAYGIVWEATVRETGRKIALKKIYEAFRNTTDSQRTYREIMFLKAFGHHNNIISVLGAHKSSNAMDLYLVFPLMRFDLHKLIDRQKQVLTDSNIRYISYQLLIALKYLHSADVIHRDLKPANVLMDEKLNVKLADFGLSRALAITKDDDASPLETFNPHLTDYVATRWYRPPEILISSRRYTKALDMWSFGCILGEMILKKVVFAGESTNDQLSLVLKTIEIPTDEEIINLCTGTNDMNLTLIRTCLDNPERGPPVAELFLKYDCATTDIMERLMKFCPSKRLTVNDALAHPFFTSVRLPTTELSAKEPFCPPLHDNVRLSIQDYQIAIHEMIDNNEVQSETEKISIEYVPPPSAYKSSRAKIENSFRLPAPEPLEPLEQIPYQRPPKSTPTDEYYQVIHELSPYNIPHNKELENYEAEDDSDYYNNGYYAERPSYDAINDDNNNKTFNLGIPDISKSYGYDSTSPKLTSYNTKQSKNLSILTLPSATAANQYDYTQPQQQSLPLTKTLTMLDNLNKNLNFSDDYDEIKYSNNANTKSTTTTQKSEASGESDSEQPEIVKKFQSLCQKYSVNVQDELGDLNSLKISKRPPPPEVKQSSHIEFISQNVFDKATTPQKKKSVWPNTTLKSKQESWKDSTDNSNTYDGDIRRIQETMSNNSNFINPYKAKGLKSGPCKDDFDIDADSDMEEIYQQIELRNSRPAQIPLPQLNTSQGIGMIGGKESGANFKDRCISGNSNGKQTQGYNGYIDRSKSLQHRRSNNLPSNYQEGHQKLNDLFVGKKESVHNRMIQLEQKVNVKGRTSLSHNSIRKSSSTDTGDGLIFVNGKNHTGNESSKTFTSNSTTRLKLPDTRKNAFVLNPYGRAEAYGAPERPYGGRQYDKKFHGPSFKKTSRSLSDTETYRQAGVTPPSGNRPTTDYNPPVLARKATSHSAYFPNSGVTHPLNNGRPKVTSIQIKERFPQPEQNRSSSTIRASELFELRNNLRREGRTANKYL